MEFRILGPLEVLTDGRAVPIGSLQQRAILAALILARDSVVSADELTDVVWGDHPPASAAATLRGLVWRLRKQLRGADLGGRDDGYRLVAGEATVDARCFERLIVRARQAGAAGQMEAAMAAFEAALALWRGPALGEFGAWRFAQAEAARLDEARLAVVEDLAEHELALGRTASALTRLEPVVREWPLRERAVGQLMVALYRLGRQADALAAYQRLRRMLADELGLDPTPAVRNLEAAILQQSDALLAPSTASERLEVRDRHRDNLPTPLTPFVGRVGEVAEVRVLLAASRLVTLTGPGGAGKTRLALEVGAAMRGGFPDGVWLVDLTSGASRPMVATAIAAGVGLLIGELADPDGGLEAALAERLRRRRLLVVLDNCEHVIEAAAQVVHHLLQSCPGLVVLATSREPLAVAGETVFVVPPLSLPSEDSGAASEAADAETLLRFDAVALFCARAQAADRTFAVSGANADAVVRICRRLDGLPLALELAAARARVLGTKELARQLHDRFAALGDGPRAAPARHQTLRAALDWSHDLLSPTEQAVLHRLGVFPASFDLDAARAVAGGDVVAQFTRLVDKSLITVIPDEAGVRYQLLESVRAYALEHLAAAGAVADAQRAHRDAFLTLARALVEDDESWLRADHFRRVRSDYANFMTALEWSWSNGDSDQAVWISAALMMYWVLSGHPEACDWMERAAAVPVSSPAMVRPATLARGSLAVLLRTFRGDDNGRPAALIAEAIKVADAGSDSYARAFARLRAIDHAIITGRLEEARAHLARAEPRFRAVGPRTQAVYELGWVMLALAGDDLEGAARALERPLERLRTATDTFLLPMAQGNAALIRARAGDPSALGLAIDAVAAARQFPARQPIVMALARAAEAAVLLGRTADAQPLIAELLDTLRQLGARRWAAEAHELAAIVLHDEDPAVGAVALGAAERLRTALGEPAGPAFVLAGALEAARDRVKDALGPERYASERTRGATLPIDEALALVAGRFRTANAGADPGRSTSPGVSGTAIAASAGTGR